MQIGKCCLIYMIGSVIIGALVMATIIVYFRYFKDKEKTENKIEFSALSRNLKSINLLSDLELGEKIGGKVKEKIDSGALTNTFAIRLSYCFNYAGYEIQMNEYGTTVKGKDGKNYIYTENNFATFLNYKYGEYRLTFKDKSKFDGKKGVIVFNKCVILSAANHVDLFNGYGVEMKDYFEECDEYILYQFD